MLLTERLEIGAGLRYFEDDRELYDGTNTQAGTFDALSPRFYVNYAVTEDINSYASIAKGFRSGGFNRFGESPYDFMADPVIGGMTYDETVGGLIYLTDEPGHGAVFDESALGDRVSVS